MEVGSTSRISTIAAKRLTRRALSLATSWSPDNDTIARRIELRAAHQLGRRLELQQVREAVEAEDA